MSGDPPYRMVATTSQKHVTKHFRVAKRRLCSMVAVQKLCDSHTVVSRFVEFILRDNCTTAIVDILKV